MWPNTVGTALTFFALFCYRRVPAMLNFSTGVGNMVSAIKTAEIKTVLTAKLFVDLGGLEEAVKILDEYAEIYYLEDLKEEISFGDKVFGILASLLPNMMHNYVSGKPASDDEAVILFTSGSEGTPKGVVLSHNNIQSNRYQVFNALPIFHSFGLTGGFLLPILSGLKIFLYPSPLHYRIVPELVYDSNATIMFGTDTFLSGYAKFAHPYDFYSMRDVFAGAEKLKPETKSLWAERFGVLVLEGYGATETSPVLAVNTAMQSRSETVGRLLPGIEFKLEGVPGIEVGGKLIVCGPNVMLGYLRAENPGFLEKPKGGWYDTGDIVEIDEEGYVKISGRAKRFAKIAGEMVSLTAVEGVLNKLLSDDGHVMVSMPDDKKGEQIILITTNKEITKEMIRVGIKSDGHSDLMAPKTIMIVDEIPLLGKGKTDYISAQKLAEEKI